jgi:hypothetical protein
MLGILQKYIGPLIDDVMKPIMDWVLRQAWPVRGGILLSLLCGAGVASRPADVGRVAVDAGYAVEVMQSGARIPIGTDLLSTVRETNARLETTVEADYRRVPGPTMTPWSATQAVFALPQAAQAAIKVPAYMKFLNDNRAADCFCWTELPQEAARGKLLHISGWILTETASLGVAASSKDLDSILSLQGDGGWWPTYAEAKEERFASTYATAWMLWGLLSQREHHLIPADQRERVDNAISSARAWLLTTRKTNGRWANYPNLRGSPESAGIAGLVLHVLHKSDAKQLTELDRAWLENLPVLDPKQPVENVYIELKAPTRVYIDEISQVPIPWSIVATIDAYPNGDVLDRVRAVRWLQGALRQDTVLKADANDNNWWRAELLYGLRYLEQNSRPSANLGKSAPNPS